MQKLRRKRPFGLNHHATYTQKSRSTKFVTWHPQMQHVRRTIEHQNAFRQLTVLQSCFAISGGHWQTIPSPPSISQISARALATSWTVREMTMTILQGWNWCFKSAECMHLDRLCMKTYAKEHEFAQECTIEYFCACVWHNYIHACENAV